MTTQPKQADVDRLARELYAAYRLCSMCFGAVTLADTLTMHCPHCRVVILPGPDITPERGREMLAALRARRAELGLNEGETNRG